LAAALVAVDRVHFIAAVIIELGHALGVVIAELVLVGDLLNYGFVILFSKILLRLLHFFDPVLLELFLLLLCVVSVDVADLVNLLDELHVVALIQLVHQDVSIARTLLNELCEHHLERLEVVIGIEGNSEHVSSNRLALLLDFDALARNTAVSHLLPLALDLVGDCHLDFADIEFDVQLQLVDCLVHRLDVLLHLLLLDELSALDCCWLLLLFFSLLGLQGLRVLNIILAALLKRVIVNFHDSLV
jgi:hypothetical protein